MSKRLSERYRTSNTVAIALYKQFLMNIKCQFILRTGMFNLCISKKVQVGKDQEKAQSEKDSKNRGGKKPN